MHLIFSQGVALSGITLDVLSSVIDETKRESSFNFHPIVYRGKFFSNRVKLSEGTVDC